MNGIISLGGTSIVANCPYFRGTVPLFKGLSSQRFEISIVVPPTDVGYNDHILSLYGNVPTFDHFFTDVSLLLVLAGWQLWTSLHELRPLYQCYQSLGFYPNCLDFLP